jgi:catechol 2,3-dioxygenase-like lactoylglutathione lyase family enzyme
MHASLRKIMVFVSDVERCADWYATHFGFHKVPSTHIPHVWHEVELGGGARLAFHQAFDERGALKSPTGSPNNPHKLVFEVADVARAREELANAGVQMFEFVNESGVRRVDGLDCEGHRFQLTE